MKNLSGVRLIPDGAGRPTQSACTSSACACTLRNRQAGSGLNTLAANSSNEIQERRNGLFTLGGRIGLPAREEFVRRARLQKSPPPRHTTNQGECSDG